jgi:hypothetical protein
MTPAAAISLTCPECRHENEIERIYCHDCGARLDRSAVSARKMPKAEPPEEVQKRLRGMFDQRRAKLRLLLIRGTKLIVLAVVAAAVAQILIPPDVPPPTKSDAFPAQINMDLEMMMQYRKPPFLRYSEDSVNGFLAYALRNKKDKLNHPLLDFKRALVRFEEGTFQITLERSIFGYPIYTRGIYGIEAGGGKVAASSKGGSIGRLKIHPELMKRAGVLFADVATALQQQAKQVARLGSVELHDKEVVFNCPQ